MSQQRPGPPPAPEHVEPVPEHVDARGRPLDPDRVDVTDEWELRYWAMHFGLSEDQLREAVSAAGDSTTQLRHYLSK